MDKQRIVVARKWENPEILAFMSDKEVGASMDLVSFLSALAQEVGNPTLLFSTQGMLKKMLEASETIQKEMKESTRYL